MLWNWEHWLLSFIIIGVVSLCDIYAYRYFRHIWKEKYYDIALMATLLFIAQNIMLVSTVVSIVKHLSRL